MSDHPREDVANLLALKTVPCLADLPAAALMLILSRAEEQFFHVDSPLQAPDRPVERVHILVNGSVQELRGPAWQRSLDAPDVLALADALCENEKGLGARAIAPTRTLCLRSADLVALAEESFSVLRALLRLLGRAVIGSRRRLGSWAVDRERAHSYPGSEGNPDLAESIISLRRVPLLRRLQVETVGRVASAARIETIDPENRVWTRGEAAPFACQVLSGGLRCRIPEPADEFVAGPGELCGLNDCFAESPRWYDATANGSTRLLRFSYGSLLDALEDDPDAEADLLRALSREALVLSNREANDGVDQPGAKR